MISDWTLDQRPLVETGKRKERKQRRLTIITLIILRERIKSFVVVVTGNGGDGGCGGGGGGRGKNSDLHSKLCLDKLTPPIYYWPPYRFCCHFHTTGSFLLFSCIVYT